MEIFKRDYRIVAAVLLVALTAFTLQTIIQPRSAGATATTNIRQEINIIDGYLYAASGSFATSSAIVQTAASSTYPGNTAYFEIVASTTAATNATISLVNSTSSASAVSVTVNGTSYARYRSAAFTLPDGATQYVVKLGNDAVGKGIIAARIIILQQPASLTSTETQIEIGNQETYTSNATSTFASPKYWYYNAAGWNGASTFYAEVDYANTVEPTGAATIATTTYTSSQSVTLNSGNTSTKIELWGSGGAGGPAAANPSGGDGGAGGQFAQSTIARLAGLTKTLTIGGTTAGCTSGTCSTGADTTWDSTVVVAKGGAGGAQATASTTGSTTGCVGSDFCKAGGNGGKGTTTYGAGGGGGPGVNATGNSSTAAGVAGIASTDGNGGAGGAKNTTSKTNGNAGNNYGAGGGGAFRAGSGGSLSGGTGAQGKAIIVENIIPPITATSTITLQEDNGAFGSWTDKQAIVSVGTASSPTRVRSAAFTPHDGKHYRIVFSNGYNGATFAIYNAKIVVDQAGGTGVIDSYDTSHQDSTTFLNGSTLALGQSFTGNGATVTQAQFYLNKTGSPTGNAVAKIYAETHSTAYGTDSIPTGTALATSDNFDVSTLTTTLALVSFTFSGGNQIVLTNGSLYVVTIEYTGTGTDFLGDGYHGNSNPNPPSGNASHLIGTTWGTAFIGGVADLIFSVSGTNPNPSLLEPQYQLANTKLANNTSLQNYLTDFDTTEWNTTNNYIHALSSANSSSDVIELDNTTGPTQITGSVVTNPSNYATSTGMCLTSSATLDTKATTNNNDIYGDSIIVQVGQASTASCGPITPSGGPVHNSFTNVTVILKDETMTIKQ
jgi:hypothetical protein